MTNPSQNASQPSAVSTEPGGHELPHDMLFPALRSDPESFPVLKAFQEYIEEERERARKRLFTVSALAIGSLVIVVSIFLIVFTVVIGSLTRRNDQLQDVVMRAAIRDYAAVAPQQSPAAGSAELTQVTETLQRMQAESSAMQSRVSELQNLPDAVAASIAAALAAAYARPVEQPPAAAAPAPAALPPAAAAPFGPSTTFRPALAPAAHSPAATTPAPAPTAPAPTAPAAASLAGAPVPATASTTAPAPSRSAPAPAPAPAAAASAGARSDERVTISVPNRIQTPPRIEGYAPANLTLVTDRGIRIPWRIVVPE